MDVIKVAENNIEHEHICCAISDQKSAGAKKEWMKGCFGDGYEFRKLEGRGKAFVEFVPAENAWAPMGICSSTVFGLREPMQSRDMERRFLQNVLMKQSGLEGKGLWQSLPTRNVRFFPIPGF